MNTTKKTVDSEPHPSTYDSSTPIPAEGHTDRATLDKLGSEPNVTGGPREQREAIDSSGRPGVGAGADSSKDELVKLGKAMAEEGNNFPGTNPHPAHTALGTMSGKGLTMPGRE